MVDDDLKSFMINEIIKSPILNVSENLETANALVNAGFYTSAFLQYWQITEVIARELMSITKYSSECIDAASKTIKTLKKQLKINAQKIDLTQLEQELQVNFVSLFKQKAEQSSRNLDIAVIAKCLNTIGLNYNDELLQYLLATKVKTLPAGIQLTDKSTVRERRNQLVHRNGQLSDIDLATLSPVFNYFFDVIEQLKNSV